MIEKIKEARDDNSVSVAIFTDLPKACNSINHELLIVKLHACSFDSLYENLYLLIKISRNKKLKSV